MYVPLEPERQALWPSAAWRPGQLSEDGELIRAVQAGDVRAMEAIYDRYLPTVWRYVYWQVDGHVHTAEDIVGETFLAALDAIGGLDPEGGSVGAWLVGIARHKLGDQRRRRARELGARDVLSQIEGHDVSNGAWQALQQEETRELVVKVMHQLADEERIVLEWKYLERLAVREIAQRLGRTEKAVESLLYRARRAFRDLFGQVDDGLRQGPGAQRGE